MSKEPNNLLTDLRGVSNLTIDAITGITDIVDSLHFEISTVSGILAKPEQERKKGISGLVYKSIHTISKIVGGGINVLTKQLSQVVGERESSFAREAIVAAMNGVLGDHLAAKNNPLAIPMQFKNKGKLIDFEAISEHVKNSDGKLIIMIHGVCMNDLQWNKQGHNHATCLHEDLGVAPIYLHYNTGLHISENGKMFSELLEKLTNQIPELKEFVIVAHSMGGLVSRGACHIANKSESCWLSKLKKIVFLGTPHHGAPLEKAGNWIDLILDTNPYSAPFSRLGKIRSAGITDLRYGNITGEDWKENNRFSPVGDKRISVPLPKNVACYSIAGTTGDNSNLLNDDLLGDGLVTLSSALGKHKAEKQQLLFPESHTHIVRGINHMELLNNIEVYLQIKSFLDEAN